MPMQRIADPESLQALIDYMREITALPNGAAMPTE